MTLRHMFRSAELITLISRMGHSENYLYSLEFETALATTMSWDVWTDPVAVNLSKLSKSEWNSELPAGFLIICDVKHV